MSDPYFFRTPDKKKIPTIGLSVFFLAILGLFAFLGFFAFPIADDHLYAMSVTHNGAFSHFPHMYTTASGRFAANLLYGVTTKRVAIVIGLGCLLFFGEFLLAYLTGKRAPSARIQTAIYAGAFAFTLAARVFLMKDILWLRSWLAQRVKANTLLAVAGGAAILMTLAQPDASSAIRNFANGELFAYREAWLNRLALIPPEPSGENLVLTLPALPSRPYPVAFEDVLDSSDKKHQWIRLAFARYHGLKDILLTTPPRRPAAL